VASRRGFACLAIALLLAGTAQAQPLSRANATTPILPMSEIRPGMRGVAWTVFEGTEPDSFPIEIIGIVERTEPGANLILVRGLEEPLTHMGIAAGMSGSPIYVDGRLLGALAFSFTGATEPLGGATPIEDMIVHLEDTFAASPRPQPRLAVSPPLEMPAFPVWREEWAEQTAAGRMPVARVDGSSYAGLSPIGLPVFVGGRVGSNGDEAGGLWKSLGLEPASSAWSALASSNSGAPEASSASGPMPSPRMSPPSAGSPSSSGPMPLTPGVSGNAATPAGDAALKPGDAFAITLIEGDMEAAAIGTVTWIEGNRLLGLGHPFFEASPIEMPIARARIHTIIPTRAVSFKVGSPLEEVGVLVGDRKVGVSGLLGPRARRIPFSVQIHKEGETSDRSFSFEIARNDILTPALLAIALQSALSGEIHGMGPATLATDLEVRLEDGKTLRRKDLFETLGPGQTAASIIAPVAYLAGSGLAPFSVASVSVAVNSHPEVLTARIEEIRVPRRQVRAGESLPVDVVLRHTMGRRETRRVELRVPETVRGDKLRLMVGSADAFFEWDSERAPGKYAARDFTDLLRILEEYPSDETLLVRLFGPSRGTVHEGREIPSLPLSKWQALHGATSGGATTPVAGLMVAEEKVDIGAVVQGGQAIDLEVIR